MLGAAAINVVLNLALIPMYGMVGAATATATSYLIILLLSSQSIRKTVDIKEPWFTWLKTIFAAAVLIGTIAFIKGALTLNPWIELCISISAGGILYCLLLFGFKIINMNELRWMLSQIGLRKSNRKD
jgi:O-antigen/teichoic acid export membrane protein